MNLSSIGLTDLIVYSEELAPRAAKTVPNDLILSPALQAVLPKELYVHQHEAITQAIQGKNVLISTSTSSGKSLCYQVPAYKACLEEPMARALFLYPTKALANDQLEQMKATCVELGLRIGSYDGDTSKASRSSVRNLAHIILTNPDMLHLAILPNHQNWTKFLKALRVIAIDEMHVYKGVFGSHVALILRRLLRLCAWYNNYPTVIAGTATIANPVELFCDLIGKEPVLIDQDGSPRGKRSIYFLNPPILPTKERMSTNTACSEVLASLISVNVPTLAFSRSRSSTELVAVLTKKRLGEANQHKVESYRAGYTPKARKELEKKFRAGSLVALSATNALELGINIGQLDAVVVNQYPGSQASFWQQIGRAGRGGRDALALYIAGENPLEQHLVAEPQLLLSGRSETVRAHPSNPFILRHHLRCAAYERPLSPSELGLFPASSLESLETMDRSGEMSFQGGHFYFNGRTSPAAEMPIRGSSSEQLSIELNGEVIGSMELSRAYHQGHEGAVYLHQGESYLVEELDLVGNRIVLSRFSGDYYTLSRAQSLIEAGAPFRSAAPFSLAGCTVTSTVIGFMKRSLDGSQTLDVVPLDMPSTTIDTVCLRIDLPPLDLNEDIESQIAAIHGAEHALLALAPLFASCDPQDLGSGWFTYQPETGTPCIFIYDRTPGGIGLCEALYARREELVAAATTRLSACECEAGCPRCLYLPQCESGNEQLSKLMAYKVLLRLKGTLSG